MRAPPFGTRRNTLRRWRSLVFLMSALVQVEHATRAPPFGTRKSSRAAHCLFFSFAHPFCALCAEVWAIRWNARGACPRSALAETPCADGAVWLFLMSALVQVEHAMRAPPFGTRKSSCAAHCLFFFCPPILRFVRRGVGKRKTAPSGGRTRTDTDFTPQDFESSASASFTTPAQITIYHSAGELTSVFATARNVLQDVSCRRREGRMLRGERGAGRVAENFKKMCGLAYANLLTKGERAAYNSGVKSE